LDCIDENTALEYVEGLLSASQERDVEAHAAQCADCRLLLNEAGGALLEESSSAAITQQASPRPLREPSEEATARRIGEVLAKTYVVERYIGRGGMGTVYEGSHRRLPRRFAIKFLSEAYSGDREATARLKREAEITSKLSHPNIVEVVDFDHAEDGTPYIVMALLEGESLAARLKRLGPFRDLKEVAQIMRQVTAALAAAHREQVVHRDLKPSNIFLCNSPDREGPSVKVVDFGLSKVAGPARTPDSTLTRVDSVLGTPSFMSPEQACGHTAATDRRADIFGLGATLYTMLTGRPPFSGATIDERLVQVTGGEIVETPFWRQLPRELRRVIERALSKDPAKRQRSMEQLWREISTALDAGLAAGARPTRGRRLWLVGVLGALALGLAGVLYLLLRHPHPSSPPAPRAVVGAPAPVKPDAKPTLTPAARTGPGKRDAPAPRRIRPRRRPPRRKHVAPSPRPLGTLIVQSKARRDGSYLWAHVFLDGARVGQTALKIEVPAGRYRVEVRRPGYRSVSRMARVHPDKRTRVLVELDAQ
jgi:serine/threonine-protein kinase